MGVSMSGNREILGLSVGDSEDKVFWVEFLQGLRARGLSGVELVISDAHLGLKGAISEVLVGSSWQRCRVHFMRNVLAKVPRSHGQVVAALIRTVFAQVDDLVHALGVDAGISKSEVSRICQEMDAELEGFRTRAFTCPFPYVFLDATYVKARVNS